MVSDSDLSTMGMEHITNATGAGNLNDKFFSGDSNPASHYSMLVKDVSGVWVPLTTAFFSSEKPATPAKIRINWGDGTWQDVDTTITVTNMAADDKPAVNPSHHVNTTDHTNYYGEGSTIITHIGGNLPTAKDLIIVTKSDGSPVDSSDYSAEWSDSVGDTTGISAPTTDEAGDTSTYINVNYKDGTSKVLPVTIQVLEGNKKGDIDQSANAAAPSLTGTGGYITNNDYLTRHFGLSDDSYHWYQTNGSGGLGAEITDPTAYFGNYHNSGKQVYGVIDWGDGTPNQQIPYNVTLRSEEQDNPLNVASDVYFHYGQLVHQLDMYNNGAGRQTIFSHGSGSSAESVFPANFGQYHIKKISWTYDIPTTLVTGTGGHTFEDVLFRSDDITTNEYDPTNPDQKLTAHIIITYDDGSTQTSTSTVHIISAVSRYSDPGTPYTLNAPQDSIPTIGSGQISNFDLGAVDSIAPYFQQAAWYMDETAFQMQAKDFDEDTAWMNQGERKVQLVITYKDGYSQIVNVYLKILPTGAAIANSLLQVANGNSNSSNSSADAEEAALDDSLVEEDAVASPATVTAPLVELTTDSGVLPTVADTKAALSQDTDLALPAQVSYQWFTLKDGETNAFDPSNLRLLTRADLVSGHDTYRTVYLVITYHENGREVHKLLKVRLNIKALAKVI